MRKHSVFLLRVKLEFHFCPGTPHTAIIAHVGQFFVKDVVDTGKDAVFVAPAFADGKVEGVDAVNSIGIVLEVGIPLVPGGDVPFLFDRLRPAQLGGIGVAGAVLQPRAVRFIFGVQSVIIADQG